VGEYGGKKGLVANEVGHEFVIESGHELGDHLGVLVLVSEVRYLLLLDGVECLGSIVVDVEGVGGGTHGHACVVLLETHELVQPQVAGGIHHQHHHVFAQVLGESNVKL